MTSARQPHPDDLFLITREELDRCCSQMSAAGYKVSANYIEALVLSRPHPSPQAPRPPCEECIYQAQVAEAAKSAREQILTALERDFKGRYVDAAVTEIRRFPESLRQQESKPAKAEAPANSRKE